MRILNQTLVAAAAGLAMLAMGCAEENLVLPGDGTPSALVAVAGDNQSAKVGEMLPSPLVVAVRDPDGNGVAGVRVRWTAEGGGSVSSPEGTTDGDGRATVQRRLGDEPGVQRTIATLDLDEAVRETFTASAVPKGNPHLVIVTEPPEAVTSGETLARAPVVQLRSDDGSDLREADVSVTVTIASGGGELDGTRTRATDDDGRASFPGLIIRGDGGTRKLIFAAAGVASITSRDIDVREPPTAPSPPAPPPPPPPAPPPPPPAPSAARLTFTDQPRDTEEDQKLSTVRVTIVDQSGARVTAATHEVKLELVVLKGAGSLRGGIDRKAVDGVATFDDLEVTRKGEYRLRATASGLEPAESNQFKVEDD